jgi:hypothetical protein
MTGFLAAMVEWVAFLISTDLRGGAVSVLNAVALVLVVLLFLLAGFASTRGRRPIAVSGYAGGMAGVVYGMLTAVLPAVTGKGPVPQHVVSYVVLILDALLFGLLFGLLGGLVMYGWERLAAGSRAAR